MGKQPKNTKTKAKGKSSQMMVWIGVAVALILVVVVVKGGLFGPPETEGVLNASPGEFNTQAQVPGAVVVDVRTLGEWNRGRLPNAHRVGMEQLETMVSAQAPDKNAPILVYCQTGTRSAFASAILKRMGYAKVVNLLGGIEAWSRAGGPVVN